MSAALGRRTAAVVIACAVLLACSKARSQTGPVDAAQQVLDQIDAATAAGEDELTQIESLAEAARKEADRAKALADADGADDDARDAAARADKIADQAEHRAELARAARERLTETDDRLEVYPFIGQAIDNFASGNVNDYLNPGDSGEIKTRETAGIAFQYPLVESSESGRQLWVYGQTTHGVRSADVDCKANPQNPLCTEFQNDINQRERALYILRKASSLEAMLGLRYEFYRLNPEASLYFSVQRGFVTVDDDDDDAADIDQYALGARITRGRYRNSYLEVGKGRNDLFANNPTGRVKVNARIVVKPKFMGKWGLFFAHIAVDADGHDGADSVQTYLGIAFCPWGERGCPK